MPPAPRGDTAWLIDCGVSARDGIAKPSVVASNCLSCHHLRFLAHPFVLSKKPDYRLGWSACNGKQETHAGELTRSYRDAVTLAERAHARLSRYFKSSSESSSNESFTRCPSRVFTHK